MFLAVGQVKWRPPSLKRTVIAHHLCCERALHMPATKTVLFSPQIFVIVPRLLWVCICSELVLSKWNFTSSQKRFCAWEGLGCPYSSLHNFRILGSPTGRGLQLQKVKIRDDFFFSSQKCSLMPRLSLKLQSWACWDNCEVWWPQPSAGQGSSTMVHFYGKIWAKTQLDS